ncbi:ABC transporter permease [Modestobacter roseus]|uniref:Peptide/nickel transport system permease protein n=1 Tax=Modestobacter roseus TaxID=1181884 RepID=A0A562IQG9_9ACTN|nr:ABC transporter permease [Modestobacter roseus]MQA33161.1 ABC transporter permease subunit [Modestobacter roseus]TWH73289.1 peptide/nickel transport system permease protein [Modestobacter roseus]
MGRYLIRRIPSVALVLVATSVIAFLLPRLVPGDPAAVVAGPDASAETIAAIRTELGLDRPLVAQYFDWIGGVLTGDLGQSLRFNRPVAELIGDRLVSTLELALLSGLFLIVFGIGLGVLAGSARARWARVLVEGTNTGLLAAPPFLVGLLFILLFGVAFRVLPTSGEVSVLENPEIGIQYLVLPALALALPMSAGVARLVQTRMLAIRQEEFIDLAVSKGVPPRRISLRHVLRNSLGPAVVAIGIRFGDLLAGAVVIEAIFARNGLGQLAVSGAQSADYTVVQVLIVFAVFIAVAGQLLTEIVLAALDPRVRLG